MMDAVQQAVLTAATGIITAFIGVVSQRIIKWLNEKWVTETLKQKHDIVYTVVQAVDQIWGTADGDTKFQEAKRMVLKEFDLHKIGVDDEEVNILIEAAVNELHNQVKDYHAKITQTEDKIESVVSDGTDQSTLSIDEEGVHITSGDVIGLTVAEAQEQLQVHPGQTHLDVDTGELKDQEGNTVEE